MPSLIGSTGLRKKNEFLCLLRVSAILRHMPTSAAVMGTSSLAPMTLFVRSICIWTTGGQVAATVNGTMRVDGAGAGTIGPVYGMR